MREEEEEEQARRRSGQPQAVPICGTRPARDAGPLHHAGIIFECPCCGSRSFEIRGTASVRVHYDRTGSPGSISAPFNARWTEDCDATCMYCHFADRLAAMRPVELRHQQGGTLHPDEE